MSRVYDIDLPYLFTYVVKPNTDQHRQGHTNPNFNPSSRIEPISSHIRFITIISQWALVVNYF